MELELSAAQRTFRDDLRSYLADLMTPALVAEVATDLEGGGPEFRAAMRRMGRDGMLGHSWPARFGGRDSSAVEQFLFADEVQAVGFHAKAQALRLMNWKQAWAADRGRPDMAESSAIKVFGSEFNLEAARALLEVLGTVGLLDAASPGAALEGRALSAYLNGMILTFGGGTNEVQRDIIAMAGLGLPNYKEA